MRSSIWHGLVAALVIPAAAVVSQSVTVLDVSGAGDIGQTCNVRQAVATSFVISSAFTNVSVSAPVLGFSATGGMWLIRSQLGPGTTLSHVVDAQAYSSASPFGFRGLSLSPGTYFLVLHIDTGFAAWPGSTSPTINAHPDASVGLDFRVNSLAGFVPASNFGAILGQGRLHVNVVGEPAVAPFGTGCGSPVTTLAASTGSAPVLGQNFSTTIRGVQAGVIPLQSIGNSDRFLGATPLPLDLTSSGMTGCFLYHNAFAHRPCVINGGGTATNVIGVPNDSSLAGQTLFMQSFLIGGTPNPLGVVSTNAIRITFVRS